MTKNRRSCGTPHGGRAVWCADMRTHLVIDGFEGDLARVEWNEHVLDVPRTWLPQDVREGDHLSVEAQGGVVTFIMNHTATRAARKRHQADLDALNQGAPQGDLDL